MRGGRFSATPIPCHPLIPSSLTSQNQRYQAPPEPTNQGQPSHQRNALQSILSGGILLIQKRVLFTLVDWKTLKPLQLLCFCLIAQVNKIGILHTLGYLCAVGKDVNSDLVVSFIGLLFICITAITGLFQKEKGNCLVFLLQPVRHN